MRKTTKILGIMLVLLVFVGASNKVLAADYRYSNRDRRCTEILAEITDKDEREIMKEIKPGKTFGEIAEENNVSENYEKELTNSDRNYGMRFEDMGNQMLSMCRRSINPSNKYSKEEKGYGKRHHGYRNSGNHQRRENKENRHYNCGN